MAARRDSGNGARGGRMTKRGHPSGVGRVISRPPSIAFGAVAASLLFCLSLASSSPPGQEAAKQQPPLQYEVSVTVKLIQVYVTDKKGKPVPDLTKDDFVILDNGKPVKITEFEKHGLLPTPAEPKTEPVTETVVPTPIPPPGDINRKFFLFFDFAFNNQKGVAKALKAASHFLNTEVIPGDEVALLSNSLLKGVTVREYLTADHRKVREAVEAMSAREIAGRADEIEEQYWSQFGGEKSPKIPYEQIADRQESKTQAEHYILRLTALAKALRLEPGQKNFILFSTGIPTSMIYGYQAQNAFDVGDPRLRPLYEDMLQEFSASNCTFYVFDTRESAKGASQIAGEGNRGVFTSGGVFHDSGIFRDDKTTGLDSLKRLSDRTGGKFFSNINMYEKNLAQVETITRAYYVLGYPVSEQWDGRFHEIKVDVKRKGCEVRAQSGYFNPKPYREFSDLEKELQLYDLALNERTQYKAPKVFSIQALAYDVGAGPRVRMLAAIPKETLAKLAGKSVEFVTLVFDKAENLVNLQRTAREITAPAKEDILFTAGTAVPPGECRCRLVIRNLETGESAVASTEANAIKSTAGKLALYSPLLLVSAPQLPVLDCGSSGKPDLFSWRDIYPYDESNWSPLLGAVPTSSGKVGAVVPYSVAGLEQPKVVLSANLISSATGQNQPVPFSLLYKLQTGTVEAQILEFVIDQVPPGKYSLYFHAADTVGKSMDQRHVPLVILP
jgi:VWFA-related protein